MKEAFDQNSIRLTLQKAIQSGHFTLEHLDKPSPGFQACTAVDRRVFPSGYEGVEFRNLLRDAPAVESVQAIPDPKDFDTVLPPSDTPTQAPKLPLTLDEEESRTQVQAGTTSQAAVDLHEPDELQPASGFEALPW